MGDIGYGSYVRITPVRPFPIEDALVEGEVGSCIHDIFRVIDEPNRNDKYDPDYWVTLECVDGHPPVEDPITCYIGNLENAGPVLDLYRTMHEY